MKLTKPLIVTGMHRSGTTLLVQLLEKNGIFFGAHQDENKESIFFQRINRWLVSINNSYWDNPKSFDNLKDDDNNLLILKLKQVLNRRISSSLFFGCKNFFLNRRFDNFPIQWGWKDPLNTFTLDIWRKIFPDLCIINIVRNPLDVSCSLINRQKKLKIKDSDRINNYFNSFIPLLAINKGTIYRSFNINSIDDCLNLYKKYYNQININSRNNIKQLNIKFEKLVNNPEQEMLKIYNFCEIDDYNLNEDSKLINQNVLNKYKDSNLIYDDKLLKSISYEF